MRRAVIVELVRSPFLRARADGGYAALHPVDLYAQVIAGLVARSGIDPALIEDVITGCVLQVAEQSGNIGRHAALAAGLPESVPAVTLDRKCGSAQQALDFAAQGIIAGAYDVVLAGGVEMMSRVPMRANRMGRDSEGQGLKDRYPQGLVNQGIAAELIAARWDLERAALDAFALRSHRRAAAARADGRAAAAIIPIAAPLAETGETAMVTADNGIREDTSLERLAALAPAYAADAMARRFPEIAWRITAGNSSQVTDGAACALVMEEALAVRLGFAPKAAVTGFAVVGSDPITMLTGPLPATRRLLSRAGLTAGQIDAFEVNEAFAAVVLAWQKDLAVDPEKVNRDGGAIALGHPVGASGLRLVSNLLATLEATGGRRGVVTMCESGGMANATLFERP